MVGWLVDQIGLMARILTLTKGHSRWLVELALLCVLAVWLACSLVGGEGLMQGSEVGKWLWIQMLGGITLMGVAMLMPSYLRTSTFGYIAWMILALLVGSLPVAIGSSNQLPSFFFTAVPVLVLGLFLRMFFCYNHRVVTALLVYLLFVAIQCTYGLLQIYGFFDSLHSLFSVTGTFHNPGPFSGFVVSGLPIALGLYWLTRENRQKEVLGESHRVVKVLGQEFKVSILFFQSHRWLNYYAQTLIVLLLLVLPAGRSRAAWLAGLVGCLYVCYKLGVWRSAIIRVKYCVDLFGKIRRSVAKFKVQNYNLATQKSDCQSIISQMKTPYFRFRILVLYIVLILSIAAGVWGLYKLKQGSADGRLLMWQVSWEMVKDKPLLGWGSGGFEAHYGNYQAQWFKSGKGTQAQELVAGTPDAPFNELVRVAVCYGLVGMVVVLLVLGSFFFTYRMPKFLTPEAKMRFNIEPQTQNPEHRSLATELKTLAILQGGMLSIVVFSLFSYPLDVAPIVVQAVVLMALINNLKQTQNPEITTQNPELPTPNPKLSTQNSEPQTQAPPTQRNSTFIGFSMRRALATVLAMILLCVAVYCTFYTIGQYRGYRHWKEAYQLYQFQIYNEAAQEYELAKNYLPVNGLLLQMYGKCLAMAEGNEQQMVNNDQDIKGRELAIGDTCQATMPDNQKRVFGAQLPGDNKLEGRCNGHETMRKAQEILKQAALLRSDPILYTTLGDVYQSMGQYPKAEEAYLHAWYMVPHKFYSKFLLVKLYDKMGEDEKAKMMANELLEQDVKVESRAIQEIKAELKRLLQK